MHTIHEPSDSVRWHLEGLGRLEGARTVIDAVLIGDWPPDPEVVEGIEALVVTARRYFAWARLAERRAA
jgi:hypothetical protein